MRERAFIFCTLLFAYAYFFGGSGFTQNATFDLTRALVERHQLNIDPYASNTADVSLYGGRVYSNKAPGLSFVTAVPYALLYALHGAPRDAMTLNVYLYLCTLLVCGISGALLGVLIHHAAMGRGASPAFAYAIALIAGLGTPLFAYSTMLFPHVPSALLAFIAFLQLHRRPAIAGAAIGAATCMNYLCAPLVLLLFLECGGSAAALAARGARLRTPKLRFLGGGLPFAIALGAYQFAAFGSPFRTSIATENPAFHEPGAVLGVLHLPRLDALWGLTFSPYRGLFYLAPVLLIAIAGVRERFTLIAFAILLLLNTSFFGWHGGYAIGPRYIIHIIPFLILGLVRFGARLKLLTATAAAISLSFNFAVTAVDPQPPDRLRDPIGKYAIPALLIGRAAPDERTPWLHEFYTGHTSTNRVAADEILPFKKHPPGSPESEWASFNLGELLFGAGAFASILPFLAIVSLASLRHRHRATRSTPDTQTERSHSA